MARTGRKSLKGKPRKPKQFKNEGYSFELKFAVLKALDNATMKDTIAQFFPNLPTAQAQSKRQNIEIKQRERLEGVVTSLSAELECDIVDWINALRKDGIPVSPTMLRLKAIEAANDADVENFLGSWSWRHAFLHRHKLSIRARARQGQVTSGEAVAAINSFSELVLATMNRLEYLPKHTINNQGSKTVWARCDGEEKERLTAMSLGDRDGEKYSSFVVVKAARSKIDAQQAENDNYRHGFGYACGMESRAHRLHITLQEYGNAKGRWNEYLSLELLKHHVGSRSTTCAPVLLLWDDMSAHWTSAVRTFAASQRIELLCAPPRFTFCCQPADVVWNVPLKDRLGTAWIDLLRGNICNNERFAAPTRIIVVEWLVDAWSALSRQTIVSCFRKCKLLANGAVGDVGTAEDEETDTTAGGVDVEDEGVRNAGGR